MSGLQRVMRREDQVHCLARFALLLVGSLASWPANAAEANDELPNSDSRPNIVVFLVDDMGLMDTSLPFLTDADGNPKRYELNDFYRTPNMERLAQRGIRFSQFYAMSVCSPTRISIMTGQNAARHHATNWINPDKNNRGPHGPRDWNWTGLTPDDVSLPQLLQAGGYWTIHVGKGHFGTRQSPGSDPLNLGFDVNIGGAAFGAPGSYYPDQHYGGLVRNGAHAVPHLDKYFDTQTFLSEALTLEAQRAVEDAVAQQHPFYLYFSHYAVHSPFDSDPRFAEHYADSGKSPAAQAFATLIEGMDKSLGDMLDQFERLGVADNTLVIFLGDNGTDAPLGHEHAIACAAPLRGKKGSHYEGGMRVPFIAAWAQPNSHSPVQQKLHIPAGAVQTQLASVEDLFPTILRQARIAAPPEHVLDGYDLGKLLSGQADSTRPETFLMHYPHAPHRSDYFTSYRAGHWKVIYHYYPSAQSSGARYQLFNLVQDPTESTNLAEREPAQLQAMMQGLLAATQSAGAQYPLDSDNQHPLLPQLPSGNR